MKPRLLLLTLVLVGLVMTGPALGAEEDPTPPPPAAVEAAVATLDADLLGGMTQEELAAEYAQDAGLSGAYDGPDSVTTEKVTVSVAGSEYTVEVYRYKTQDEITQFYGNILWTALAAFLVFFMQAGFALVEAGFTRAKNAVNIIMKNLMDFSIGSIAFFVVGFHLMFAGDEPLFFLGSTGGEDWGFTFWIFQTVFAATAATIVSGAMAERTKFVSYLVYSVVITAVIYPIFGSFAWGGLLDGGGWLESRGFLDFAGSTVVHSIGGWLALAGALALGPRIGKYSPEGKPRAIMGHNIPIAALGVFILWLGWFGFNPGSTTAFDGNLGRIAVTTNLAAAAAAITAMFTAWIVFRKPDASMALNGALAGLVSITAPCDICSPAQAVAIGAIGGVIVVFSVLFIDRVLRIDDPVGAASVHGTCGAWGTLSCGLLTSEAGGAQFVTQLIGVAAAFVWAFGLGLVLFYGIRFTMGLRVSEEEELKGLDVGEHGMEAYSGFQIFTTM